jgi:hypothetical protein
MSLNILAQTKEYLISKAIDEITIDGVLDEKSWAKSEKAKAFYMQYPADTSLSKTKTEVMMTFDDDNIYILAICFDDQSEVPYVITSLRRDYSYPINDAFAVYFDTYNDKTNGFGFSVNPLGVQREGLIQNSGDFGVTTAWDNKWFSKVKEYKGYWIVEMKIPFKTIRYKTDSKVWGVNFSRNNLKINENSAWNRVPINFNIASLNYTGRLVWKENPPYPRRNISVIPYAITDVNADYENSTESIGGNIGLDTKIAITSALNLDLTVNPDFSNVEVDRQVTNLSRFSLFYPERRQFFIENSDLFGRFAFRNIRPFFSRRIGLSDGEKIPIIAGARLSGKLNEKLRIGLMNMQTEGKSSLDLEAQNYTVASFQRQIGLSSNIAGIFVNQQGFNNNKVDYSSFNRISGLEYNMALKEGKWRGKFFYLQSFTPNNTDNAHASWLMYNTRNFNIHWNHEKVGENFRAETGFVPRIQNYNPNTEEYVYRTYWRLEPSFRYNYYPNSEKILNHSFEIKYDEYFNDDFSTNDRSISSEYKMNFTNKGSFELNFEQNKTLLLFDTDVTFSDNTPLDSGYYNFNSISSEFNSSSFSILRYNFGVNVGEYFTGEIISVYGGLSYRLPPYAKVSIDFEQNKIWMPLNENTAITLISSRFDITFTKKMFFTTFIQYNTQIDNINLNTRFQYRFKPMSDIYLVYTDNYNSNIFGIKNRAFVLKLIYWIQ